MTLPYLLAVHRHPFTTYALALAFVALTVPAVAEDEEASLTERHTIELESTIVGDKEQPAVSYFIPWQDVGTPDKLQWNIDRKHDDTLDLLDRDVMLRSMQVYDQMNLENPETP